MADLFYRSGEVPAPLPFSAVTAEGELRTDLANHPDSVDECGFQLAPARPDDTAAQRGSSVCLNSLVGLMSGLSAGFRPLREAVG